MKADDLCGDHVSIWTGHLVYRANPQVLGRTGGVKYFLFIPLTLAIVFDPLSAALVIEENERLGPDGVEVLKTLHRMKKAYGGQL